jgi:hypothetical protein
VFASQTQRVTVSAPKKASPSAKALSVRKKELFKLPSRLGAHQPSRGLPKATETRKMEDD